METFRVVDLWEKDVTTDTGRRLGRIEAVGMGRDRVPRRVGVRMEGDGPPLTFFGLTRARIDGDTVILAVEPRLHVVPGRAR